MLCIAQAHMHTRTHTTFTSHKHTTHTPHTHTHTHAHTHTHTQQTHLLTLPLAHRSQVVLLNPPCGLCPRLNRRCTQGAAAESWGPGEPRVWLWSAPCSNEATCSQLSNVCLFWYVDACICMFVCRHVYLFVYVCVCAMYIG